MDHKKAFLCRVGVGRGVGVGRCVVVGRGVGVGRGVLSGLVKLQIQGGFEIQQLKLSI